MQADSQPGPGRGGIALGVLLITAGTYVAYTTGLLSNAMIARGLNPIDFGRYAYVVWLSGWLVLLINNGLTTSGIRFVSELRGAGTSVDARLAHGYLLTLSRYSEAIVMLAFAALAILLQPAQWAGEMTFFVAVVLICSFAKSRYLFDISIAKGYSQFKVEAYSTISISLMTAIMILALYLSHAALHAYLMAFTASSVAFLLMAGFQLRRMGITPQSGMPGKDVLARMRPHIKWTALLAGAAIFGNKSIEVFFLNAVSGPRDVGFFSIGAALTRGGIDLLTSGLMTVLMPAMANAFGRGGEVEVRKIFAKALRYFAFAGMLAAGSGYFLGGPTVKLLYGSAYLDAIPAFQVMVLISGITLADGAFGALLSTTDRQRSRTLLVTAQIVITLIAAALLIPRYGLAGAIIAHATSRLLGFLLLCIVVVNNYNVPVPVGRLIGLVLTAVFAAAAAWACTLFISGIMADVAAAILYALLLAPLTLLARFWSAEDFAACRALLERHMPGAKRLQQLTLFLTRNFSH